MLPRSGTARDHSAALAGGGRNLSSFIAARDYSLWMHYNGFQRRLYVAGVARASVPFEAWSGGGQTNQLNQRRRSDARARYGNSVPTDGFPFDPFRASSTNDVTVTDYRGHHEEVSATRGGVLPTGLWVAVFKDAPEYRVPRHGLGNFPTWWLYPLDLDLGYRRSRRNLDTFYIHVTGFLGSDGCIVMEPRNLDLLASILDRRPYTFLKSAVFEGTELDGKPDVSHTA